MVLNPSLSLDANQPNFTYFMERIERGVTRNEWLYSIVSKILIGYLTANHDRFLIDACQPIRHYSAVHTVKGDYVLGIHMMMMAALNPSFSLDTFQPIRKRHLL